MIFLTTLIISMFVTMALVPVFRTLAIKVNAMDMPNRRKVHSHAIPRSGGIAIALGGLIPVLLWAPGDEFTKAVLIGGGIVVLFGLIDDVKNLGWKAKLASQVAAALIVVFYGGIKITSLGMLVPGDYLLPDWFAIPLTLIVIVGVTNAINFSDGLDGLAGGISFLAFICIGYLAYLEKHHAITLFSAAVVGSLIGFLRFNSYPAVVFMGDSGSQLLGFLAATLSLQLTQGNTSLSPLLPLILLGLPVLDTLTVMTERAVHGRSMVKPDKNHLHHKLMRFGLYHTEAVFVIYVLQAFLVTSAFVCRSCSEWFFLILYTIFSCVVLAGFFVADRTGWKFKRYRFLDKVIKGKLRILKERQIFIKVSFSIVKLGLPSLLLFTCFLAARVPKAFSFLAISFIGFLLITWLFNKKWMGGILRLILCLSIPCVVYLSEANMAVWMDEKLARFYNLSFGVLALFVILTLKFTRRKNGFKTTSLHFLILFVALVVPNLPDEHLLSYHMGLIAAKITVFLFGYEILAGEFRGEFNGLNMTTIGVLIVMSIKGFIGSLPI